MGCSACMKKQNEIEMVNGSLPEESTNKEGFILDEGLEKTLNNDTYLRKESADTENLEADQERSDEIFDFFNELRQFPHNFLEEAKIYDLTDIITSAENYISSKKINVLIKNPFFNLFLNIYVKKTPYSKEDILNGLENNNQLNNYKKFLYYSESPIDKPNECVWNLLKNNKEIALKEILYKKSDYFMVSAISLNESNKILAYFLFFKKL